jgi:hypothetical protein
MGGSVVGLKLVPHLDGRAGGFLDRAPPAGTVEPLAAYLDPDSNYLALLAEAYVPGVSHGYLPHFGYSIHTLTKLWKMLKCSQNPSQNPSQIRRCRPLHYPSEPLDLQRLAEHVPPYGHSREKAPAPS